jgi:hypothetical protein
MDPISAIGLIASVAQTLSALGELIKYVNQVKRASEDKVRLALGAANLLVFLTGFYGDIAKFDLRLPQYSGLKQVAAKDGPLDQLLGAVRQLSTKLRRKSRWNIFRSMTWPLGKWEVDEVMSLIESLKSLINLSLTADNFRMAAEIETNVTELKLHAETQQQGK